MWGWGKGGVYCGNFGYFMLIMDNFGYFIGLFVLCDGNYIEVVFVSV